MKYPSLTKLVEKLKSSSRVRGIFTTGTTASQLNPSSDIDLIVLLDKNDEDLKSVYTTVEGRFADIFFFDVDFIHKLQTKQEVSANDFEGMFAEWLMKGKIEYDPDNLLTMFRNKIVQNPLSQNILKTEKTNFWLKINYNFIANSRYYQAPDSLYHKALEFRLLYSVMELTTAYFAFRDIPWRGEKMAVRYFEQNDPEFLSIFQKYIQSSNLEEKMKHYQDLFAKTFFGDYREWEKDFIIPLSWKNGYEENRLSFWNDLIK
ncbi:MAG: hypothetical protein WDZ85_02110 [Candidatus Paceibacterota bacterium]